MLKNLTKKDAALIVSGLLGFAVPAYFAWEIYHATTRPNAPTWLMVFILDFTGLWVSYAEGNRRPYLQVAWMAGATLILGAVLSQPNIWYWGPIEIGSFVCCLLAVILWRTLKENAARYGLALQSLAVYISFFPQVHDYWKNPAPDTWYLWAGTAVASVAAIYAAAKHDAAHTFVPYAAIVLNIGILTLIFR